MSLPLPSGLPTALLDTTMDQLRTLLAVHEAGTALAAARLLGREQSSVQKQLDTMNRNLGTLCGEPLVLKRGRGQEVRFTATGEALVELARTTLREWAAGVRSSRLRLARCLSVGSTRYTLDYLLAAVEQVSGEFEERGVELRTTHVRSGDLLGKLASGELDLVCGSVLTTAGEDPSLADCEVMEWRRSGLALLTNLPEVAESGRPLAVSALPRVPLVVSAGGVISGFLRGWFGTDYRNRLSVTAEIDTVQYGFQLLRSGVVRGCMLVTEGIGDAVGQGLMPEASGLRTVRLTDDTPSRQQTLVGVFTRYGERSSYGSAHPMNLLWDALYRENARRHGGPEPADRPRTG